jgi:hypothetical protein
MLKKVVTGLVCLVLVMGADAQRRSSVRGGSDYNNALGLHLELGTGRTLVGPSFKHFFSPHDAGQFNLLFAGHYTQLDLEYQYHGQIQSASGLKWYLGLGPSFGFGRIGPVHYTDVFLRPVLGLDYKVDNAPLNLAFDWRPTFLLSDYIGDRFNAARFGLGVRFTF